MLIDNKEVHIKLHGREYHCALDITMNYIGGKWKTVVLWYLRKEKKRFSELRKLIPAITEKMLSIQLKQLEKDGLVGRKVYGEVPPRVEYFLTDFGQTLVPMLEEIARWGRELGDREGKRVEVKSMKANKNK